MKKLILILLFLIVLIGCGTDPIIEDKDEDTTPPLFLNAQNHHLPKLRHEVNSEINLLDNITVIDDVTKDIELSITDNGSYDNKTPGTYQIVIEAKDEAGNTTIAYRIIEVYYLATIKYSALVVKDRGFEYELNSKTALEATASGAKFRSTDKIQIMTKAFFLEKYDEVKNSYSDNGNIPFLAHGVIGIFDNDLKLVHLRIAPNIEVNGVGDVKSATSWTNTKSSIGGGNFKGLIEVINSKLPGDGYIFFAPSFKENKAKNYLIQNLYYSKYDGTNLSLFDNDVEIQNLEIKFEENYEETIEMVDGQILGEIVKTNMILDGIPLTTYYKHDKKDKKLIFFFHGFSGNRETGIMGRGEELANMGFYVVAIDAYLHGEREPEFFKNLSYALKQKEIVNIVVQTAKDAQQLYHKYFKNLEDVDTENVYAYGVSMGAATTFYLATIMEELTTFASIVGSPSMYEFYKYKQQQYGWLEDEYYLTNLNSYLAIDPLINYDLLKNKNFFMGVGTKDTTVPLIYAKELASKLKGSNILYKEYEVAHSSTAQMTADSYNFILKY